MRGKEEQGLLGYILAHPDDDDGRLVYADWLEEAGQSDRAELIRVQLKRAALPRWDAAQLPLKIRESQLLKEHEDDWKAELPRFKGVSWGEFRRGFISTARFNQLDVLKLKAGSVWAATPLEGIFIPWPVQIDGVDSIEPIAGLREISISSMFVMQREVRALAESPLLSTLHRLTIRDCNLGVDGFSQLVASPYLGELRSLSTPGNSLGNAAIDALFDAKSLNSLQELDISEDQASGGYGEEDPVIDDAGMQTLAAWTGFQQIRKLVLNRNDIRTTGLRAILQSENLGPLTELGLRDTGLNASSLMEFADLDDINQFEALDLGENRLRDGGLEHLTKAPCCRELKVLQIDRCELADLGGEHLAKAPFLNSLRRLNVSANNLLASGLQEILDQHPEHLHTLQIANNSLRYQGAVALAESPTSAQLQLLDIGMNVLGDDSLEALVKSPHLGSLRVLHMLGNRVGPEAAMDLMRSPLGQQLVTFENSELNDEGLPF